LRQPSAPLCELCGQSDNGAGPICANCLSHPPRFSRLRSWSVFAHPVRQALHALKYRGDMGLAEALVPDLALFVSGLKWSSELLVPVPLGKERLMERGYNQAGLISWPLSLALDLRHAPGALRRTRETPSQVGLSRAARRLNVRGAFEASSSLVRGRSVLLLDDVATTGATLSSCADALFAAEARDVLALTVARAHPGRDAYGGFGAPAGGQQKEPR
jgi:ComF family protein